ncbi:MAG TPA: GatB/YqeY domain-containing protein [Edaphocola sp.]|nr:GatB/YqeY domain-containing protein [Edaphocola sp.]
MSLEDKVMAQLKQAMKDKNEIALRTLRAIKAALLEAKTAANAKEVLTEADEMKLLQKMAKQRKDSLAIFKEQNREDLAQKEAEELSVLEEFLPKPLDEATLKARIQEIIAQSGASGPGDMGKVMGLANKQLAGQAEGSVIAQVVRALLAN